MASKLQITVPSYAFTVDKALLRKAIRGAATEVADLFRSMIRRSQGSGQLYSKPGGGTYRASAAGEAPVSRTGTLANSIKIKPTRNKDGFTVRDTAFYALFLAVGAKGGAGSGKAGVKGKRNKHGAAAGKRVLLPRLSLTDALNQRESSIDTRVRAAIIDGIAFQRIKP